MIVAGATGIFYTIYYFGENYAVEPVLNNLPACIYCWFSILAILAFMKKMGTRKTKYQDGCQKNPGEFMFFIIFH